MAGNTSAAGGGLALTGMSVTVDGSTVSGNRATGEPTSAGGGLLVTTTSAVRRQTTVSGNRVEGDSAAGAGLRAFNSHVDAHLVTITGNTATGGAAVGGGLENPGTPVFLRGAIVAGNTPDNCASPVTSGDHNLQDGASCDFDRASDQSRPDPRLGPLAANGGLTLTHLPLPGSPALDRGPGPGCPARDQRGVSRPRDGDGSGSPGCDVGAVERSPGSAHRVTLPKFLDPR